MFISWYANYSCDSSFTFSVLANSSIGKRSPQEIMSLRGNIMLEMPGVAKTILHADSIGICVSWKFHGIVIYYGSKREEETQWVNMST